MKIGRKEKKSKLNYEKKKLYINVYMKQAFHFAKNETNFERKSANSVF